MRFVNLMRKKVQYEGVELFPLLDHNALNDPVDSYQNKYLSFKKWTCSQRLTTSETPGRSITSRKFGYQHTKEVETLLNPVKTKQNDNFGRTCLCQATNSVIVHEIVL